MRQTGNGGARKAVFAAIEHHERDAILHMRGDIKTHPTPTMLSAIDCSGLPVDVAVGRCVVSDIV